MFNFRSVFLASLLSLVYLSSVQANPPVKVIAYQIEQTAIPQNLNLLGHLQASQSVILLASATDRVHKLHFREGQQVVKNQLLVELNIEEELAQLEEIKVEVEESEKQYYRVKNIEGKGMVTASLIDEKYREWKKSIAKQKVIEAQIEDRKIVAPFNGFIGLTTLTEGALIQAGSQIATLDNSQLMKLDLLVPIQYLSAMKSNLKVSVLSAAFPDRTFSGHVAIISPVLDPETRMIQVRALVENPDQLLKTNMMVQVEIDLPQRVVLQVPNSAVLMLGDHQFAYRLKEKEQGGYQFDKVVIKTGQIGAVYTEVTQGLEPEDLVISQGIMRVNSKSHILIKGLENSHSQEALLKPTKSSTSSQQVP